MFPNAGLVVMPYEILRGSRHIRLILAHWLRGSGWMLRHDMARRKPVLPSLASRGKSTKPGQDPKRSFRQSDPDHNRAGEGSLL